MSYMAVFERNGKELYFSNLITSETSLVLSPSTLSDMTDEEILDTVLWFRENAQEINLVLFADECHFNEQFINDNDIQKIIDSTYASPEIIARAKSEKHSRSNKYVHIGLSPKGKKPPAKKKAGWVYVMQADKYYKIGISQNVSARMNQISPKMPFVLSLLCKMKTSDMSGAEAKLHEKYSEFRVRGEWFELPPSAVEELCLLSKEGVEA